MSKNIKKTAAFYNREDVRQVFFQVVVFGLLAWFFYNIYQNTITNMELRGIQTGFGFLNTTAGFDVLFSLLEYDSTDTFGRTFVVGLLNTLLVAFIGIILATIVGFLVGIARLSSNWLLSKLAVIFIEVFRNVPLLLQIFFWYSVVLAALPNARNSLTIGDWFAMNTRGLYLPKVNWDAAGWFVTLSLIAAVLMTTYLSRAARKHQERTGESKSTFLKNLLIIIGLPTMVFFLVGQPASVEYAVLQGFNYQGGLSIMPELIALLIALSLYTAAFIAEAVRAGMQSVSRGQIEAARALGLREGRMLRLVLIPQAMRVIIPPLNSQYQNLLKNSSLAMAAGYPDLVSVFMGTTLNQTGQAVEIVFLTMATYLLMNLLMSAGMNLYNSKLQLQER